MKKDTKKDKEKRDKEKRDKFRKGAQFPGKSGSNGRR